MSPSDSLRHALDSIAAALAEEAPWTAVSAALVALTGAGTNSLWVGDPRQGRVEILGTSFDASVEQRYRAYYHRLDLWTLASAAHPRAGPVFGAELVAPETMRRSEIHSDFYRPLGIFHLLAAGLPLGGDSGFMALGLHRPEAAEEFSTSEKQALELVVPSLRRGLRLREEMRRATGAAVAALAGIAQFETAALVLEAGGRILFANDPARALLTAGRGLASRNGCLATALPADGQMLAALLRRVAQGGMGGLLRLRHPAGLPPLVALASRPAGSPAGAPVLVLLLDPAARRRRAKAGLLAGLHGLTLAEAEVAAAAATGLDAAAIAAERGTSVATIRAQLRQVLDKTGAESLRSLAAMLSALPEQGG